MFFTAQPSWIALNVHTPSGQSSAVVFEQVFLKSSPPFAKPYQIATDSTQAQYNNFKDGVELLNKDV